MLMELIKTMLSKNNWLLPNQLQHRLLHQHKLQHPYPPLCQFLIQCQRQRLHLHLHLQLPRYNQSVKVQHKVPFQGRLPLKSLCPFKPLLRRRNMSRRKLKHKKKGR